MIPKIIHYCWLGENELPDIVIKCINSWKTILCDFEIREWNESNLPINEYTFMREAYLKKKYAFVSDQARYWVLKKYGGIFLDTDVEVVKNLDEFLDNKVFFGIETHIGNKFVVNPGLIIGAVQENKFIEEVFNKYITLNFISENNSLNYQYTSPNVLTSILNGYGFINENKDQLLKDNIRIYSSKYFDPIDHLSVSQKLIITKDTYTIHWGAGSWLPKNSKFRRLISLFMRKVLGNDLVDYFKRKNR